MIDFTEDDFVPEDEYSGPDSEADGLLPEDEEQEMFEHFRFELDKGQAPMRVDKYLSTHMENTSRHRIQLAIKEEYVRVNGKVAKANCIVRPADVVTFVMPYQRRGLEILPEDIPLDIVYEDDDLLVVNKPAGLVVHPGHGHFSGTLVNALAHHLGISQGPDADDERMGVLVHRIDKDTSGLLVVAKNDESQLDLARQFFVHSIERRYVAIVWGNLKEDEGTITGNIGRDPSDRMRFKVFPDGDHGKHAVTHYRVLERFGYVTVVECRLETGRTHQITTGLKSGKAPSTPNTASSSKTASSCCPDRPCTPRRSDSHTRARSNGCPSTPRFRTICRLSLTNGADTRRISLRNSPEKTTDVSGEEAP